MSIVKALAAEISFTIMCRASGVRVLGSTRARTMLPQGIKKAVTDNPKKLANLIDLVNLPSTLREFVGQSQISRLGCFVRVWSYIKDNNLQVLLYFVAKLPACCRMGM